MSTRETSAKPAKRGGRHPLLLQQHLNEQNFWVCVLLIGLTTGLLIWNPPQLTPYRPHLSVTLAGSGLVLVLTFVYRLTAYVQCGKDELRLQLPFYRLPIPYSAIRATRPNQFFRVFPPQEQRWTQRYFLRSLWGATVVVVDLEQFPRPRPWLRLWMGKYLLDPTETSIILPVRDWIAFRSELDEFLSRHRRSIYQQ